MITTNLQDLTGNESGAVYYPESGEIWIGNWSSIEGLPREFVTGTIGLGETLKAKRCAVPRQVKEAMQTHDVDQGADRPQKIGYKAWQVNETIVVIHPAWN